MSTNDPYSQESVVILKMQLERHSSLCKCNIIIEKPPKASNKILDYTIYFHQTLSNWSNILPADSMFPVLALSIVESNVLSTYDLEALMVLW